jgi:hypothetical protein
MASRPELVECCIELDIDWRGMSIEEMKMLIREAADKKFRSKKIRHSATKLSEALRKFLTEEYDYVIKDRKGKKLDYRGRKK